MPEPNSFIDSDRDYCIKFISFLSDEFFELFYASQKVTSKVSIPDLHDAVHIIDLPIQRNRDPHAFELKFHCYSSCFQRLNARTFLKIKVGFD